MSSTGAIRPAAAGSDMRKIHIYILGLLPLAILLAGLQGHVSGGIMFVLAACYVVALRLVCERLGKD